MLTLGALSAHAMSEHFQTPHYVGAPAEVNISASVHFHCKCKHQTVMTAIRSLAPSTSAICADTRLARATPSLPLHLSVREEAPRVGASR